jgi:hypothetical protein
MKAMHRLMVTNTYRMQSSNPNPAHAGRTARASFWEDEPPPHGIRDRSRQPAEVAGQLDTTMGARNWIIDTPRRSLYFHHTRFPGGLLKLFNALIQPTAIGAKHRRSRPWPGQQQAQPPNGPGYSRRRCRPSNRKRDESAFVNNAFEAVLGRLPNPKELVESLTAFCGTSLSLYRETGDTSSGIGFSGEIHATEPNYGPRKPVHVLFNHNDFVTIR